MTCVILDKEVVVNYCGQSRKGLTIAAIVVVVVVVRVVGCCDMICVRFGCLSHSFIRRSYLTIYSDETRALFLPPTSPPPPPHCN